MDEKITPTIIVVKPNGTKSLLEKLQLARSFMFTVIIYAQFAKSIKFLKDDFKKLTDKHVKINE